MQRRLVLALVGIALAAIVLVGAGVLILAQIGARAEAETEIDQRLELAADYLGDGWTRNLDLLRSSLGLERLEWVTVADDGQVSLVTFGRLRPGPPRNGGPAELTPVEGLVLDADRLARYQAGETVLVATSGDDLSLVQGLRRVDDRGNAPSTIDGTPGVSAARSVVTVGRRARLWFVLSGVAVVTLSLVVAWWLARRLTRPIHAIRRVTAAIAGGDFDARVTIEGRDELADLGRSVNAMAGDLQRSRALDQQFLMSVSHDLRTPLTAIAGYAEALSDGATDDPVHAGRVIANHAGRLERLVGDLLDLAKLDANRFQFHLRPLDVNVAVGRTVAGLVPTAERFGVDLAFVADGTIVVEADPDRLAQAVANLIDNALKFARTRVTVTVRPEAGEAVVTVDDDGPGIPADDLPHVFERLYVSSAQPVRAENPSGMGLAIVRELITAMGGRVGVASGPAGGTTMTLRLPADSHGGEAQAYGSSTTSSPTERPERSSTAALDGPSNERLR